jgi:antitoxin VapB
MSLNLKDEETVRMVRELAILTGENLTTAVRVSVKERLERLPVGRAGLAERIMAIARETAPLMNDGRTSKEIMDALYDPETGLPV